MDICKYNHILNTLCDVPLVGVTIVIVFRNMSGVGKELCDRTNSLLYDLNMWTTTKIKLLEKYGFDLKDERITHDQFDFANFRIVQIPDQNFFVSSFERLYVSTSTMFRFVFRCTLYVLIGIKN